MYKIPLTKFYGNPSEGATPLHTDRQTDVMKLIGDFHGYVTHCNNWVTDNIVLYNRVTGAFRYPVISRRYC